MMSTCKQTSIVGLNITHFTQNRAREPIVNFLQKLFAVAKLSTGEVAIKRTPEMQLALNRIEARKQKEQKETTERQRRERLFKSRDQLADENKNISSSSAISSDQQLRQLEKKGHHHHADKLEADSGIMANSKMDLWLNTIAPQEAPDTIAPHLRIPDTVFNIETNKFESKE